MSLRNVNVQYGLNLFAIISAGFPIASFPILYPRKLYVFNINNLTGLDDERPTVNKATCKIFASMATRSLSNLH